MDVLYLVGAEAQFYAALSGERSRVAYAKAYETKDATPDTLPLHFIDLMDEYRFAPVFLAPNVNKEWSFLEVFDVNNRLLFDVSFTQPIRAREGQHNLVRLPISVAATDTAFVEPFVSEYAALPATTLTALAAPKDTHYSAIVVRGVFIAGLERPTIALKYGVAAHRWHFTDFVLVGEDVLSVVGTLGRIPTQVRLYDNEDVLLYFSTGASAGRSVLATFRHTTEGAVLNLREALPVDVRTTVLVYRHVTQLMPDSNNVPPHYALFAGETVSSSRSPNRLAARWIEFDVHESLVTPIPTYAIAASRPFEAHHLFFGKDGLLSKGQYVLANDRLVLLDAKETRIRALIFEQHYDTIGRVRFYLNEEVIYPQFFEGVEARQDACAFFTRLGDVLDLGHSVLDDGRILVTKPTPERYISVMQGFESEVLRYSFVESPEGVVPQDGLVAAPEYSSMLVLIDGKMTALNLPYLTQDGVYKFPVSVLGKRYRIVGIRSEVGEALKSVRNYRWADPQGRPELNGLTCQVIDKTLAKDEEVSIPNATFVLVCVDGWKAPRSSFVWLPHQSRFVAKVAGDYRIMAFSKTQKRNSVRLFKQHFSFKPDKLSITVSLPPNTKAAWVFVEGRLLPAQPLFEAKIVVDCPFPLRLNEVARMTVVAFDEVSLNQDDSGQLFFRRWQDADFFPVLANVPKDNMLVWGGIKFMHEDDYEVSFWNEGVVLDLSGEPQPIEVSLFALLNETRSAVVSRSEWDALQNQLYQ